MIRFFYSWVSTMLVLGLWLGMGTVLAQVDVEDLPPITRTYVLTNVTIHTEPGQAIPGATVVIKDGLILAVGTSVKVPGEAILVDADSMHVYAGFIDGMSQAGIEEEEERRERPDDPGNPPKDQAGIQPQREALNLLDPSSGDFEKLRNTGFTVSHVVPQGGMLPGQGSLALLAGKDADAMRIKQRASMFMQFEGAGRMYPANLLGVSATFKQMIRQAQYAIGHVTNYEDDPSGLSRPAYSKEVMALAPVVKNEMPAFFLTPSRKDIFRALNLQEELGDFPLILGGLEEGAYVVEALKAAEVPIFLSLDLPDKPEEIKEDSTLSPMQKKEQEALAARRMEAYEMAITQAAKLQEAGVRFGFVSQGTSAKDIPENLKRLVSEGGLSEEAALAALTTVPAEMLGLMEALGTVEEGKVANLVVSSEPYFSESSTLSYVFVDGQLFEMEKKKKKKSSGEEPVDISGTWAYTVESPQGRGEGELVFTGEPGSYEGTISSNRTEGENELEDVEVDGANLTFSYSFSPGGNEVTIEVSVEIEGDSFEGTLSVGSFGSFPIEGERKSKPD